MDEQLLLLQLLLTWMGTTWNTRGLVRVQCSFCLEGALLTHLKVSAAPHKGAGAKHHEADDHLQDHARHRGRAFHPADPRPRSQQVFPQAEFPALRQLHWNTHTYTGQTQINNNNGMKCSNWIVLEQKNIHLPRLLAAVQRVNIVWSKVPHRRGSSSRNKHTGLDS